MFYRQKSRVQWLKEGDKNTKFFHSSVKKHNLRNCILSVETEHGTLVNNPDEVPKIFVDYFQHLLQGGDNRDLPLLDEVRSYLPRSLGDDQIEFLSMPVLPDEIKQIVFSLASNKAPGPDGFTADFFKTCWDIVGDSVIRAVSEFFETGRLLRETNSTILSLVPKCQNATSVNDYRPIACCNTVYKCISKLIARRIARVLPSIISPEQNAFVKGRRISDNILLAQELFSGFHLCPYLPKSVLKVDFRKAYDTVCWKFLRMVLCCFGFPDFLIRLIMTCVSTAKFSVSLNGELFGYFSSSRGIRQGDPMSSYLFTMVMEVFSGILHHHCNQVGFDYFWRCKRTKLSHLFFADDVLLFSQANIPSISIFKEGIRIFSEWSGLSPNPTKSEVFFSGVSDEDRVTLLHLLGFQVGSLPISYLGLPIITSRLSKVDCVALINAITSRIRSWTQRFLSYGGRLQLIRSVLLSIHIYWSQVFVLPRSILDTIEKIVRQFLWKGPNLGVGGAKVSWNDIGFPKQEGGLGIRRLRHWNKAIMFKHIWTLFVDKESLWCRWIHANFLKTESFWVVKEPTYCSWAWRKILEYRAFTQLLFKWKIGDGTSVSFWFDNWHPRGPLYLLFTPSDMRRSGLQHTSTVADFLSYTGRSTSTLTTIFTWTDPLPVSSTAADSFTWMESPTGIFSTSSAWDLIRVKKSPVSWAKFVWHTNFPPRYQFHLWIISKKRLPTQVLLLSYGRIPFTTCAFCRCLPDSIDHLYFGCPHTAELATFWAAKCNLPWRNQPWVENLTWATRLLSGMSFHHSLSRFAFGALCYIIWKERNNILFRGKILLLPVMKKRLDKVVKDFALQTSHVPDTPKNIRLCRAWGLPSSIFR